LFVCIIYSVTTAPSCSGAVATGFVKAGGLEGIDVWKNAKSAVSVAQYGYRAMERGELVPINGPGVNFANKIHLFVLSVHGKA